MRWAPLVVLLGTACYPTSNVCNQVLQPITGADGGRMACTRGEDCTFQGEQTICTTDGVPTLACVSCDANQCTAHVPVQCK